jgi:hypothetical protein
MTRKRIGRRFAVLLILAASLVVAPAMNTGFNSSQASTESECCTKCDIVFNECLAAGGDFASCCTVYNMCVFNDCGGFCPICTPPPPFPFPR